MSFRIRVYESKADKVGAINGIRFATADEADRSGVELGSRWFGFDRYAVEECDEPVTYTFPAGESRPTPLPKEVPA